ncbi:sensor histidine kinase [Pseudonocardia xinjiangensis]|uniref:sensor histidine kinase n=1 Tax=Pseudonocardia xinjiangensis TaxID=75289 RepID=UPI003D94808B
MSSTTGDADELVRDPTRMSAKRWYVMAGGWSLLLTPWLYIGATSDHPPVVRVLLVTTVVAYIACYVHGLFVAMRRKQPAFSAALVLVMAALWAVMVVGFGPQDGAVYTVSYVIVTVIALVPSPWTAGAVALAFGGAAGIGWLWLAGEGVTGPDILGMLAISVAMLGQFRLIRANSELREAREELARLAVTAERERMARDLHDVLGHSLTTITVKAGLARRLLESGDVGRAGEEVTDVEQLGRQALAEVRSTVSANRVASLGRELAGAREALRAAGIEADLPAAVDDVPPDRQQAFAHVVREGVTNTIRHSGAGRCAVRLTPMSVEIVDDGVGSPPGTPAGHGISGLAERLAAVGGRVEAGPAPTGGYRLLAEVLPRTAAVRRREPAG